MQTLTQIFSPRTPSLSRHGTTSKALAFSRTPLRLKERENLSCCAPLFVDSREISGDWAKKVNRAVVSAVDEGNMDAGAPRRRKVVEHICLLKAKEDLSEEQEKDMLDHLYTIQYQLRGIVAISLGRISDENLEQYTHAIFMRFQTKGDLAKFYENPSCMAVFKEHVIPYCHGFMNLDFESEVEDDIIPIFRKGEEFNYGVEHMLLVDFIRSSLGRPAEDAMVSLAKLTAKFPSLIVQATEVLLHLNVDIIVQIEALKDITYQY
ncbi:stress responsive alpha-beta barrel domain protein [Striga asiatica]|uniref:Stress responsive alpha-beta barrel domain protein n=1 Tax=Striga asiatica TaxID=4170 RepID=A0A5A7PCA7_STRAF|nr:stress responsive alpha-beta barrel domain protein [Striga asiatica]